MATRMGPRKEVMEELLNEVESSSEVVEEQPIIESNSMRDFAPQDEGEPQEDDSSNLKTEEADQGDTEAEPADTQEPQTESEENFAHNFDPRNLPEELVPAYKQMQGDYTRKTTEVKNLRSQFEQYAPVIEYLQRNPNALGKLFDVPQPQAPTEPEVEPYPDDVNEFAKRIKQEAAAEAKQEALREFMEVYQKDKTEQQRALQIESEIQASEKLDPRLATDEVFANDILTRVTANPGIAQGRTSLVDATRQAIIDHDTMISRYMTLEKRKLSDMAKSKRSPQAGSSVSRTASTEQKINSMRDAVPEEFR